jgi:hypothetical protein
VISAVEVEGSGDVEDEIVVTRDVSCIYTHIHAHTDIQIAQKHF